MNPEKAAHIREYVKRIQEITKNSAGKSFLTENCQGDHFAAACKLNMKEEAQWMLKNWNVEPYAEDVKAFSLAVAGSAWETSLWILQWEHPEEHMRNIQLYAENLCHKAAANNQLEVLKKVYEWFLSHNIPVNGIISLALVTACEHGHRQTAEWCYNLNIVNWYIKRVAITSAARLSQHAIVEWLLKENILPLQDLINQMQFWQNESYNGMEKRKNMGHTIENTQDYDVHIKTIDWLKSQLPPGTPA